MHHSHIQTYFFLILLSVVLVLTFFIFLPYLNALIVAGVLAVIFRPLFKIISGAFKNWDGLAALVTILLVIIAVVIPLSFIGQQIVSEARVVFVQLNTADSSSWWQTLVSYLPGGSALQERIIEAIHTGWDTYLQYTLSWFVGNVGLVFSSVAQAFVSLFIGLVAFYYFLKDGSKLKQRVIDLSPLSNNYDRAIFTRLQTAVNSVIRGQLVIAIIQGLLTGIGLSIFGVPNPALWGAVAMFAALVPALGTSLVLAPAVFYTLITGELWQGVGLLIWSVLAVGLIDNFLGPRIIGRKIHVHSLLTLLAILGGVGVFGPIGFLVGPLVLSLLIALLDIYKSLILQEGQIT